MLILYRLSLGDIFVAFTYRQNITISTNTKFKCPEQNTFPMHRITNEQGLTHTYSIPPSAGKMK